MRVFLIIALAFLLAYGCTGGSGGANYEEFAKCLTSKGVKMYGAYWCGHCNNQKSAFGTSWQYVTYVECGVEGNLSAMAPECRDAGIRGYPTWLFTDGSRIEGETTFAELSARSGCSLPVG